MRKLLEVNRPMVRNLCDYNYSVKGFDDLIIWDGIWCKKEYQSVQAYATPIYYGLIKLSYLKPDKITVFPPC